MLQSCLQRLYLSHVYRCCEVASLKGYCATATITVLYGSCCIVLVCRSCLEDSLGSCIIHVSRGCREEDTLGSCITFMFTRVVQKTVWKKSSVMLKAGQV